MRRHGPFFLVAAAIAVLAAIAHEILGAPAVLSPLEDTGLPEDVIGLHQFSWHVGTIAVLTMVALFALAAWHPLGQIFAIVATTMSAAFAVLGISLAVFGNSALWQTPAPYPWAVIALLGSVGTWLGASNDRRPFISQ